jgi:hypothetical protein
MISKVVLTLFKSIHDKNGKVSSARISSYIILASIILSTLVFLAIDIVNLVKAEGSYTIPIEHSLILGMILTHHLMLLEIKKSEEKNN